MKTAEQWLAGDDQAWLDNPASIIEQIQREAFAAGLAEGVETVARGIDARAAKLGSQLAVRVEPAIPRGLVALAAVARELPHDPAVLEAAWQRCGAGRLQVTEKRSA